MATKKTISKKKTIKTRDTRSADPALEVDSDVLDGYLGYHIRRAMQAMRRSFFQNVGSGTVRPGQASLLELVARNPGASQVQMAEVLGFDKATIVSLIDDSEAAGWITRQRSPVDRRRHELVLTKVGEQFVTRMRKQTGAHEKSFRTRFTDAEMAQFVDYLQRVYRD
ncbi:MAG: winged helix-turn-helix transcriptional regulator [Gammaproteobacteria bacterium]|nr:winged helix-turn-helix transcriptional regulator [Gammaproteobacteria bacterium]